jgi:ERCC4-type nuclease
MAYSHLLKYLQFRISFKTIRAIINASPQELNLKAKIPHKILIKIWKILNEEYKEKSFY